MLKEIEKAIRSSDLGMSPNNDGKMIRLTVPPMSGEQRQKNSPAFRRGDGFSGCPPRNPYQSRERKPRWWFPRLLLTTALRRIREPLF